VKEKAAKAQGLLMKNGVILFLLEDDLKNKAKSCIESLEKHYMGLF
jgi:hypothetical protein